MAGKHRYLLNRNGHYWTRIVVPMGLRSTIGKSELLEALGDSEREALQKHPAAIARLTAILDLAKARIGNGKRRPVSMPASRLLTPREMAMEHYRDKLRSDDEMRDSDPRWTAGFPDENYIDVLRRASSGAASDDELFDAVGWIIAKFRDRGAGAIEGGSTEWRVMARAIAVAELEAEARRAERDENDFTGKPSHPLLTEAEPRSEPAPDDKLGARILSDDSTKTLGELLPRFLAERNSSPSMQAEHHVSVRMFEEFLGEPTPVYKVTRSLVNGYKNALMQAPANYAKRFPGMTLPQAIEANQKRLRPYEKLQARTVNGKWLSRLHAFFNWCVQNDALPDNPATGVKIRQKAEASKPPRSDFTPSDLSKIVALPMFEPFKPLGEEQWAILISLFAGTRPSELAQVRLDSIRRIRGVLVFQIEEETKNRGSQRLIPVHKTLLDLGLEKRITELRRAGETHLFPVWHRQGKEARQLAEEKSQRDGKAMPLNHYYPRFLPKRFNVTFLPKVGVKARGKDFYSFRHTFKTGLALAGVPKAVRDYLTGHHDQSPGSVYEHDVSIEHMKEAVDRLSFDGLELSAFISTPFRNLTPSMTLGN